MHLWPDKQEPIKKQSLYFSFRTVLMILIRCNSLSTIRVHHGIDSVHCKYCKKNNTSYDCSLSRDLLKQLVKERCDQIKEGAAAKPKNNQSFRTDSSVEIQKITGIIPPIHVFEFPQEKTTKYSTTPQTSIAMKKVSNGLSTNRFNRITTKTPPVP